jgi:hypothetical protein
MNADPRLIRPARALVATRPTAPSSPRDKYSRWSAAAFSVVGTESLRRAPVPRRLIAISSASRARRRPRSPRRACRTNAASATRTSTCAPSVFVSPNARRAPTPSNASSADSHPGVRSSSSGAADSIVANRLGTVNRLSALAMTPQGGRPLSSPPSRLRAARVFLRAELNRIEHVDVAVVRLAVPEHAKYAEDTADDCLVGEG